MSDLCLYELEDIAWDDFCQSDDHIVPRPSSELLHEHSIPSDSHKTPCHEVKSISNCIGDRYSPSRRRNTMLEKDSWSNAPSGVFPSSSESNSIKEVSSLPSENTRSSNNKTDSDNNELCANNTIPGDKTTAAGKTTTFSDAIGNIGQADNNLDFFENTEDKDSSELLYYGWPEIGNFDDVDRMFRSCDSTFGLGTSKEDEVGWFASADNIGGSEELVKSEFQFPCPEANPVEYISQNHDNSKSDFINDFGMPKDSSWTSEKSDSYMSFVNGPDMASSEDRFIPKEQIDENKKQVEQQKQSAGKRKELCFGNGSFDYTSNLPNEATQLPMSYMLSNNSPSSELTLVNRAPSSVKSETHQLQNDPRFPMVPQTVTGKREKLHNRQGSQSSAYGSLKKGAATVQTSIVDPGLTGNKPENPSDAEGGRIVIPAELGSSHVQEGLTMSSGMDNVSQEAASFRQLQLVMEQLDLRTKICIRDSLYRLARSAEQRHNHANLNSNCGDERDATGAFMTAGTNTFMDMETDTNPIDRSIAHLLFHRPSESRSTVRESVISPPLMVENLIVCEETASKMENDPTDR
ncbi:hypothetical protein PHJA_002013000 [Phtheirospermum japonicum]|uniref:Protein LNK1 n=1 Tax=Phtheirospermum japonicum TaxID=374723 RepID=A0A830CWT0_9LAMI|nr:hypothetical protein PHJA_002013000 [Phtheirospermum japonicum]